MSSLPGLVHYLAVGVGGDDLRVSDTRRRLPALHIRTDQHCSLVLRFGSHQLCQMDTCPSA